MEYVEGSDLSALVKKHGPLSVGKAVNYMLQAARGLEFAHKKGVIHRDVKPGNLLLDTEGTVKILDMGLARLSSDGNAATQAELTGTGAALGTVDYMAPEQAVSTKHADARADIYGLGCSLHYLLTGKATYDGDTLMAKLLAHRETPIPSLGADVPEQVQAIFEKMVAKTVEDRYQTMTEVVVALEQCSTGQQTSLSIQQSVGTGSSSDLLTFLRNVTLNTIHKPKPTKKPAPTKTGKDNKKFILGAIAAAFLGLVALAVTVTVRTKDGTLVVEVDQPDATVQVLNGEGKVEISQHREKGTITLSVDPGKHRLKVEKDGFRFFAKDFEMKTGGKQSITAMLLPIKAAVGAGQPNRPWNTPAFQAWMKDVAAMSVDTQVEAVVKKLKELNPGFDGKESHKIEGGVATELQFHTDNVMDVAPLMALERLRFLNCDGNWPHKGKLFDLSPLKGMKLTFLSCGNTQVSDLSPLEEMPLKFLNCSGTQVSDLLPLKGMPLKFLNCSDTQVSDLSPLKGMPLTNLWCYGTSLSDLSPLKGLPLIDLNCSRTVVADLSPLKEITLTILQCHSTPVSDLSPLKGMPLTKVSCEYTAVSDLTPLKEMHLAMVCFTPRNITKGTDVIRQMKSLKTIGTSWEDRDQFSPVEFWKKYDAAEFNK
jgi:hypothetical protein